MVQPPMDRVWVGRGRSLLLSLARIMNRATLSPPRAEEPSVTTS